MGNFTRNFFFFYCSKKNCQLYPLNYYSMKFENNIFGIWKPWGFKMLKILNFSWIMLDFSFSFTFYTWAWEPYLGLKIGPFIGVRNFIWLISSRYAGASLTNFKLSLKDLLRPFKRFFGLLSIFLLKIQVWAHEKKQQQQRVSNGQINKKRFFLYQLLYFLSQVFVISQLLSRYFLLFFS